MSFHRTILVALATLFMVGMTSMASACCGDWGGGYAAPVAYTSVGYGGGFGGYGGGCGGCGVPTAAAVYSVPVAPAPIAVNTCCGTAWGGTSYWGNGGGCCNRGLWSGGALSSAMGPGDTIVVPEKVVVGGSAWKNIVSIAQIAQAAALAAAVAIP